MTAQPKENAAMTVAEGHVHAYLPGESFVDLVRRVAVEDGVDLYWAGMVRLDRIVNTSVVAIGHAASEEERWGRYAAYVCEHLASLPRAEPGVSVPEARDVDQRAHVSEARDAIARVVLEEVKRYGTRTDDSEASIGWGATEHTIADAILRDEAVLAALAVTGNRVRSLPDEWRMRALNSESKAPPPGHPDRAGAVAAFVLIQALAAELEAALDAGGE